MANVSPPGKDSRLHCFRLAQGELADKGEGTGRAVHNRFDVSGLSGVPCLVGIVLIVKCTARPTGLKRRFLEQPPSLFAFILCFVLQLQQRLMTASDNSLLCRVVELIEETGQYKIDDNMFNFDLCNLDRHTVQKLQTCLLAM